MWERSVLARYKVRWEHILLIVVVAAGLAARLHEIGYNLDGDEIFSLDIASKHFAEMISRSLQDTPHPPLHNVLLHLWTKAFGTSEVSSRSLSILFSGAFLLTSYALLRRFIATWLALGVLTLFSLSPLFVYYGQQARPYALIAFLSAANLLAFIKVLEVPRGRGRITVWAILCAFWLYAQYLAILFIAFQICLALFYSRSERLTIFAYGSVGSALMLPWLIAAMGSAISTAVDPLPHTSWIGAPTPIEFLWFYVSIFGEMHTLKVRWLLIVLAALGVAYVRHLVVSRNLPAGQLLFFLVGIAVPTVVYAVSVWGPKPVFAGRQLLGAAIAFVVVIGLCMAILPRNLAVGFLLTLLAWTAAALPQAFPHNSKPPWRDMAAQIDARYASVAVVAQEGWVSKPLAYYQRTHSVRLWSELAEHDKGVRLLFACRPPRCSDVETEELKSRRSLVATWRWGEFTESTEFNQLRLYELAARSLSEGRTAEPPNAFSGKDRPNYRTPLPSSLSLLSLLSY